MNMYIQKVKELRIEKKLSQEQVAQVIGVSRPTYTAIEAGKQELSLDEAKKLATLFGIGVDELLSGVIPNMEKYKHMILAYLRMNVSEDGKIPKTKLAKLLYLADFAWFYDNLESMSGMQYRKIQYGPVPDSYFRAIDELFENGQIEINPTEDVAMLISQTRNGAKIALTEISKDEEKLIKSISEKWKDKNTQEIVTFTHNQLPYAICLDNEIIPYELITQENPGDVY